MNASSKPAPKFFLNKLQNTCAENIKFYIGSIILNSIYDNNSKFDRETYLTTHEFNMFVNRYINDISRFRKQNTKVSPNVSIFDFIFETMSNDYKYALKYMHDTKIKLEYSIKLKDVFNRIVDKIKSGNIKLKYYFNPGDYLNLDEKEYYFVLFDEDKFEETSDERFFEKKLADLKSNIFYSKNTIEEYIKRIDDHKDNLNYFENDLSDLLNEALPKIYFRQIIKTKGIFKKTKYKLIQICVKNEDGRLLHTGEINLYPTNLQTDMEKQIINYIQNINPNMVDADLISASDLVNEVKGLCGDPALNSSAAPASAMGGRRGRATRRKSRSTRRSRKSRNTRRR